jgi:hypothetical protein
MAIYRLIADGSFGPDEIEAMTAVHLYSSVLNALSVEAAAFCLLPGPSLLSRPLLVLRQGAGRLRLPRLTARMRVKLYVNACRGLSYANSVTLLVVLSSLAKSARTSVGKPI